jgi:hypothetical protein
LPGIDIIWLVSMHGVTLRINAASDRLAMIRVPRAAPASTMVCP